MTALAISLDQARRRKRGGGDGPPPAPPADLDWDSAPFSLLGLSGGLVCAFDASGQLRELPARDLGAWQGLALLAGGTDWLLRHFRALDRDGIPTARFNARAAGEAIIAEAHARGLFDPAMPRREYGVWGTPDGVAVHLGRTVQGAAGSRRAGFVAHGALWPAMPAQAGPGAPCGPAIGAEFVRLLGGWTWQGDAEGACAALAGIVAVGMLGSVAPWRPHGLVCGAGGTGKSTLMDFLGRIVPFGAALNDFSEAGIRQRLSSRAALLLLDEAEGDDSGRLQRVIELLRRASGGEGVRAVRGSPGGQSRTFDLVCNALMGAILPPPLLPQDAMRFAVLHLAEPPEGAPRLDTEALKGFAAAYGPALWGRVLAGSGRFLAWYAALRDELLRMGFTPRQADQVGALGAGWQVLVTDAAPAPPFECLRPLSFLLASRAELAEDDGARRCLARLLGALDPGGKGARVSIAMLVEQAASAEPVWAEGPLRALGMRWLVLDGAAGLFVASRAPEVERLMGGTEWVGGRWLTALGRLPGARSGRDVAPQRMGIMGKIRGVWVPEAALLGND